MPKIIHFRDKCIGCNSCVEHSAHWMMNRQDGKSDLLGGQKKNAVFIKEIPECERGANENAARDCPVNIIHVTK